jgi:HEAT repeat protein
MSGALKWQSTDRYVRRRAVEKLTDSSILEQIAENDASADVRVAAVKRVAQPSLLARLAKDDRDNRVRCEAVGRLTDQPLLAEIATSDPSVDVREAAVKKLTDKDALRSVAHNQQEEPTVRLAAGQVLGDDALLGRIAALEEIRKDMKRSEVPARREALKQLATLGTEATAALRDLVYMFGDPDRDVRWTAAEVAGDIGNNSPEVRDGLSRLLHSCPRQIPTKKVILAAAGRRLATGCGAGR